MSNNLFRVQRGVSLIPQSSAPSSPANGDIYYDATLNTFVMYENGTYINLASQVDVPSATTLNSVEFTTSVVQNSLVRITGSVAASLYGMTASSSAKQLTLYNEGSATVQIFNQNAGEPTAANQFITQDGTTINLLSGSAITVIYDSTQPAWVVASGGTINLASQVTGVLPIANGGTNNGSLPATAGGVLYTDGTMVQNVGVGTAGQILESNGAAAPTWSTIISGTLNLIQTYSGAGSYTWTVPNNVNIVYVLGCGGGSGGGGGGGGNTLTNSGGGTGGGGGGGANPSLVPMSVIPGDTVSIIIGAGGNGGIGGGLDAGGSSGSAGSQTTFGSIIFGGSFNVGGGGAQGSTSAVAGGAGAATGWQVLSSTVPGGNGGAGTALSGTPAAGIVGGISTYISTAASGGAAGGGTASGGGTGGGGGGNSISIGGMGGGGGIGASPAGVGSPGTNGSGGGGGGGAANDSIVTAGNGGVGGDGYIAIYGITV